MVMDFNTTEAVNKDSTRSKMLIDKQHDLPIVQHLTANKADSINERAGYIARNFSPENLQKENERIMQGLALAQQHVNKLKHRLCIS